MESLPHHLRVGDFQRRSHYDLTSANPIEAAGISQKASEHLMPVNREAQLFIMEVFLGRNPKRHASYLRDWGADVVSNFSSAIVALGTESLKSN